MTTPFPYDVSRHPPAPVLPARIGRPGQSPAVLLGFLIDTGADLCAIPDVVARHLRLPRVSQVSVRGVGGIARRVRVYAAEIETAGERRLVEVVGLGEEPLIGRDVLNEWTVVLRGPRHLMELSTGSGG